MVKAIYIYSEPDTWFDYFKELNSIPKSKDTQNTIKKDTEFLESKNTFDTLDFKITQNEVIKSIKKIENNKSAGLDGIKNEMIKYGQNKLLPCITQLFNTILLSHQYPSCWASGYITPIHKTGNTQSPENYRGITITSNLGKLFNSILNERLESYLDKNNKKSDLQIGFEKKKRCSDHIFILNTIINKYFSKGEKVFACFVDFSKAFDTVAHDMLFYKLLREGIAGNWFHTIKCLYTNMKICVNCNGKFTPFVTSKIGVRQGDPLSSSLFKLFINDLTNVFYENESSRPIYTMLTLCR